MTILDIFYPIAKEYIWANQHIDRQVVFKTFLLTPFTGVRKTLSIPTLSTHMPDYNNEGIDGAASYLILEIGGLDRETMGIDNSINLSNWISLDNLITQCKLFTIVFSNYRLFNLSECYLRITASGIIILAVDYNAHKYRLIYNAPIYFKLYSNVDTTQIGYNESYLFDSTIANTQLQYDSFKSNYETSVDLVHSFAFLNGYYLPDNFPSFNQLVTLTNNNLEYFVDPELKNYITIDIADSVNFSFQNEDYIVFCSPEDTDNMYCDDLEFFVSGIRRHPVTESQYFRMGIYIPRFSELMITQLTFKDWVIKKSHYDEIINSLTTQFGHTPEDIQLHVLVRNSNNNFFYIQDSSRITDIMNLPTNVRKEVFTNINSLVDFWRADQLIDCAFNNYLRLSFKELSNSGLNNCFSSYGVTEILERIRWNPYELTYQLPVYTHDAGWLIRFSNGLLGTEDYYASGATSQLPYLNGDGSELWFPDIDYELDLDIVVPVGQSTTTINQGFGIFCYYTEDNFKEMAIYETDYSYADVGNDTIITWEPHMVSKARFVRVANRFIKYSKNLTAGEIVDGWNIYNARGMMHDVGLGKSLIWFKDRYLIEELDYFIHNSVVHIVGKWEWQDEIGNDTVKVIYAGLPHYSLTHVSDDEWGFIAKGKLSYNNRYDLYNNRHRMVVGNGLVIPPSEFFTAENYEEINNGGMDTDKFVNGTPYAMVNLPKFSRKEELEIFSIPEHNDAIIDDRIEIFLSEIYPQATDTTPILIPDKYDLFSPFMNKIMDEILNTNLIILNSNYTDEQIDTMVTPYKELLIVDPCTKTMDWGFIDVHPLRRNTPISVTISVLWFINQINRLFLNNRVKYITRYLQIDLP